MTARERQSEDEILRDARAYCQDAGLRLTTGRELVLSLLARSPQALKAYELLEQMGNPMPPTVYRALDFWLEQGFVHRIESLNAFFACGHPLHAHGCQLLICMRCNRVVEVCNRSLNGVFAEAAAANGFLYRKSVLEIHGICPACQTDAESGVTL
jgi:Fur family zinc uptake transcriptional regulator